MKRNKLKIGHKLIMSRSDVLNTPSCPDHHQSVISIQCAAPTLILMGGLEISSE